jgi:hypothetical protein
MSVQVEIVIVIGILYLSDCLLLLYFNEAVVERVLSEFRARLPSDNMSVRGRLPYLLNPLMPGRLAFVARWDTDIDAHDASGAEPWISRIAPAIRAIDKLVPYASVTSSVILIGLPIALLRLDVHQLLPIIMVVYLSIAVLLARVWTVRADMGLTRARFTVLAFQCVACPPYAANLMRRIALGIPVSSDVLSIATSLPQQNGRLMTDDLSIPLRARMAMYSADSAEHAKVAACLARVERAQNQPDNSLLHDVPLVEMPTQTPTVADDGHAQDDSL